MKGGFLSLQTSLTSLNFPTGPRHIGNEDLIRFPSGGVLWGSFCWFGRYEYVLECGFAPDLWVRG